MKTIDLWHLCDEMTVPQATLLLLGLDPADHGSVESKTDKPEGYEPVSTALKNAVLSNILDAKIVEEEGYNCTQVSWYGTKIGIPNLKYWLKSKSFTNNFFFENEAGPTNEFSNSEDPFYAPKLDATITAWRAVTSNPDLLNGRTPKQALEKWLRQNGSNYGLTKDDGNPNESAIEDICKVANWNLIGGVAKTTPQLQRTPPPIRSKKQKNQDNLEDIPF